MAQISGRVFLDLQGIGRVRSKEGAKLNVGGIERTPVESDSGVDGYTEKPTPPQVDFKISHTADTKLSDLQAFKDKTLTFQTDTGRIYTLNGAFCAKPPELEKGEVSLVFNAIECIEG
jgi:Phage tail tube protein